MRTEEIFQDSVNLFGALSSDAVNTFCIAAQLSVNSRTLTEMGLRVVASGKKIDKAVSLNASEGQEVIEFGVRLKLIVLKVVAEVSHTQQMVLAAYAAEQDRLVQERCLPDPMSFAAPPDLVAYLRRQQEAAIDQHDFQIATTFALAENMRQRG